MNRREAITAITAVAAAPLILAAAPGGAPAAPPAVAALEPKPLPFDVKKLRGLSDKLIASHHDNNYTSAVKNLVKVRAEIAATTKDTPGFVISALRDRELNFTGSMVLHELYFANLGGDGKPAGSIVKALASDWEERLRATANALGGGSGWATVEMSMHTGELGVFSAANHTQSPAAAMPLLVIDMYEHAYAIDFGAAAGKYVDAVFANLNWEEVERRYQRALKARAALTG